MPHCQLIRKFGAMETKVGLNIASQGNVAIASFRSTCVSDVEEIAGASVQIKDYIDRERPSRIVFDFGGVKFFSSQVLGLLLEARAYLQPYSGQVVVCGISEQLRRVFKITNLDKIFTFFADRGSATDEALGQLA
jgi:anti-anti-sigma factor